MNTPEQPPRPDFEHAWERRLDAELRQLPGHTAPASLLPDVMAVVRAREALRARAWWRRPATMWHPALRVSFGVVSLALVGAMILGLHLLWPDVLASSGVQALSSFGAKLAALWDAGHTVLEALGVAAGSIFTPWRLTILGVIVLSQVALLGAGGAALRSMLQLRSSP